MDCEFKDDVAQCWLQVVEDQSCDFSWLEDMQPLNGLVIQRYALSQRLSVRDAAIRRELTV
jgi:hypothetical protein